VHEIIMDSATSDERAPVWKHQVSHVWCEVSRQDLGEELAKIVNQTDRQEILDLLHILLLM
jgi:hypothetical protein